MIYRKKIWTSQPQGPAQINWSNPLTAGLTDWIDLRPLIARSALPTGKNVTSQASAITGSAGQGGIGLRFPGGATDGKLTVGGNADYTQANQTWVVICSARALAASGVNGNVLLSKHDSGSSANGYTFFFDSTTVAIERKGSSNAIASISFDALKFPVVAAGFSFDNSFFRVSANGRISTDATSPATTFTTSQPLNIGDAADGFWNSFDGVIYAVFGWSGKTLAPTELAEVTRNPWQLFAPQTKPLFFTTTAQQQTDGVVFRKKQWTSQPQTAPQIDWGNSLTQGLIDVITPGFRPTLSNIPRAFSGANVGWKQNGSTEYDLIPAAPTSSANYTALVFAASGPQDATFFRIIAGRGPKQNGHWELYQDKSNSRITFFDFQTNSTVNFGAYTDKTIAYVATRTATAMVSYADGVKQNTATYFSIGFTGTTAVNLTLGQNYGTPSSILPDSGTVYLVATWQRILSDSEIASVSRNPWQLFAPQKKPLFFSIQGTAGQTLTPSLFTNSNTFYSATVTPGAVTLTPGLYTNTNTFYSATVTPGAVTLTPDLFTNTNSFYSPTVTAGAVTLTPALFTNTSTFYSAIVSQGGVILQPDLYTNTNSFYSATVTVGAVTLTPDLFTNTNSFYSATVTSTVTLTPDLYTNSQTFYTPTVTQGAAAQTLEPSLYQNTNVFYSPTVAPGTVTLTPDLFTNTNAFYSPTVVQATEQTILPDLFVNTNIFFQPTVDDGTRVISIADVGAEDERRKKRQKKRDKEFALLKQEQDKLITIELLFLKYQFVLLKI
jgi:hypothetical protein